MKKLLSFVAAFLIAVVTAVGVHAADPSTSGGAVAQTTSGSTVTAVSSKEELAAAEAAGTKAVYFEETDTSSLPATVDTTDAVLVGDVETVNVPKDEPYTFAIVSDLLNSGTWYDVYHFNNEGVLIESSHVQATGRSIILTLTAHSPVVIKKSDKQYALTGTSTTTETGKKAATKTGVK